MTAPACSQMEFVALMDKLQSPSAVAKHLGVNVRNVCQRIKRLEGLGHTFVVADDRSPRNRPSSVERGERATLEIKDGTVLVGTDGHYWPGHISTGHRAFVHMIQQFKPTAVILAGDMCDFGGISRWPSIGWQTQPEVKDEIESVQDRLEEIEKASLNSKLFWPLGSHDQRLETLIATNAEKLKDVRGTRLKDHFPRWKPCWSVMINDDCIVKHNWHNGIHAVYNDVLRSGVNFIGGHKHSLKVTPYTDLRGDRYGVDCGMLADPWGPQFYYMRDDSRNWRSGFCVLTFKNWKLMPPELVHVVEEGKVWFRGQEIAV